MKKKILGIFVMTLLITTSIVGVANNMQKSWIFEGPPGDFTEWFPNPIGESDMEGTDFNTSNGAEGRIHRITDTKSPPTEWMDICDEVTIEWKKPSMKRPWVTYHIDDMSPTGGHGWYFHFDYKRSNRVAPFDIPEPEGGLPPWPDDEKERDHHVDDGNTAGPWDGTYKHPYQHIQDGIDAAGLGDTVRVFPGTYYENLLINKDDIAVVPVTYETPIIDGGGSGSVVVITGDWVTLHGFRIQNSGTFEEDAGVDVQSDNNTIFGNVVVDNQNGIYIHYSSSQNGLYLDDSSKQNSIFENNIQNNVWGLFIMYDSDNSIIYNNNFISNSGFHVKDYSDNHWDSEFFSGNYWDDYTGIDSDGDGIGDTPYSILGGANQDHYPLVDPWENQAPDIPVIDGPNSGNPDEEHIYTFISSDLNEHDVIFEFKWGDGTEEKSPYYVASDSSENYTHAWNSEGTYNIEVRAIDYYGEESDWATLEVSMPKSKTYINTPFLRFLENHPRMFPLLRQLLGLL